VVCGIHVLAAIAFKRWKVVGTRIWLPASPGRWPNMRGISGRITVEYAPAIQYSHNVFHIVAHHIVALPSNAASLVARKYGVETNRIFLPAASARCTAECSYDGLMPKSSASQEYDHGRRPKATSFSITRTSWGLITVIIRI